MAKRGLGKGLGALIDVSESAPVVEKSGVQEIDVNQIDVYKEQPRKIFDEEKLRELSESIAQHGIIQPLIVKKSGSRYMIVAGERRYRAARLAGLSKVPVIVKDVGAKEVLELSIIENIQREDLNPIEEAQAIAMLMDEYSFTQDKVAQRLGCSRSAIANTLRLLNLPDAVRQLISVGALSAGHARALLALKEENLIDQAAKMVVEKELSVRETEQYVKKLLERDKQAAVNSKAAKSPEIKDAERRLSTALETKVTVQGDEKKGRLTIEYYSREQLEALYEYLLRS